MEQANACCNWVSEYAWSRQVFPQFSLHKLLYYQAKELFPLSAQVVVHVLAKVADAYKQDKKAQRRFARQRAIRYDSRILIQACTSRFGTLTSDPLPSPWVDFTG
jgi:putative transposase